MIKILYIHQGAELYGSDKVLLNIIIGLNKKIFKPLVILPNTGLLYDELKKKNIEVYLSSVLKITRKIYNPLGIMKLPFLILKALIETNQVMRWQNVNIVNSNTLAVLSGAFWSKYKRIKHIWHVHEIIESPLLPKKFYPWLIRYFSDHVICNSYSTKRWLVTEQPSLERKLTVIWNGIDNFSENDKYEVNRFREKIGAKNNDLVVTLVGRISRLKGQHLLVDAAKIIKDKGYRNIRFLIVGNVFPGYEKFKKMLDKQIKSYGVDEYFYVSNYIKNVGLVWQATDIAVVPSTEPESFGLVAVEAMNAGKPVIASDIGGLQEIIRENETGLFFPPGDFKALSEKIIMLVNDKNKCKKMGENGRIRQYEYFSLERQLLKIADCYINS